MKKKGLEESSYLYRERTYDEVFPWHRYDVGIEPEYLWHEREAALQEEFTPPCFDDCHRCGVCR